MRNASPRRSQGRLELAELGERPDEERMRADRDEAVGIGRQLFLGQGSLESRDDPTIDLRRPAEVPHGQVRPGQDVLGTRAEAEVVDVRGDGTRLTGCLHGAPGIAGEDEVSRQVREHAA
jgi:hypothetical protein